MIEKISCEPRGVINVGNSNPLPQDSQSPESLGDRRFKVRQLNLYGSDLSTWEGRFHDAPLLEHLDIRWVNATQIPNDVKTLKHLKTLCIINMNLLEFPMWICEMTELQSLTVSGTNMTRIPDEVSRLTNLTILGLGNNLLTRFDVDLRACKHLGFLSLADNNLEKMPSRIPPETCLGLAGTPFRAYSGFLFKNLPLDS